jgi:predicted O-linked N-acetylglucosamine transferase (SPINDLY family)
VLADQAVAQGVPLHQSGRFAEAEACYRQALALVPAHPEALHLLGLLAHQIGRSDIAQTLIERAIGADASRPTYHLNHGAALQALGRLDEAVTAWRRALALRPAYPEAFNNLGVALQALGRLDEAVTCFERAITLVPAYAEAHFNLGVARQAQANPDQAVTSYRAAIAARPAYPAAHYNLGNALREGLALAEAVEAYRAALALDAGHADAQNNLGVVLQELGERDQAIECFRRTIALQPDYPRAHTNLAHLLRERGQFEASIEAYRQALALRPDDASAHSGLILVLDHHEGATPAERLAERRSYNTRHAHALTLAAYPHQNDADPDRPIRVGYVSGDFYYHSAATGIAPVILSHDPAQIEVYCYASNRISDAQTARFKQGAPNWRDVAAFTDEAVAAQIRADGIDILVDLGGHSASGRLLVFARRPAPVQVTAWGYVSGTGLDAIDYLLADPVALPPQAEHWYHEKIVHLPSIVCYQPFGSVPDVAPAPLVERGTVTFGSFNRATKLTAGTLDLWARVVASVPGSRMVLKSPALDDDENRARILAAFAARGVAAERVAIQGQTPSYAHLAAYGQIDVQLDPFPHGGGATTFDGLLQGVPCITLLGELIQARASASFLTTVGLTDLIARTPDEYVEIAGRLAADPDRLRHERATLRERVLASPLGNPSLYTRAVEQVYRTLWRRWCEPVAASCEL